jgi:protein phosphatase
MNPEITQDSGGKLLRLLRPSIVVLCGPSACGKSSFAKRHFRPTQIISSDWARALVCDDERDQRFNTQAFELVHFLLEQRLTLNRLCVVDSTALTTQARKDLLNLARRCQVQTTLILFNVPLETCIERDEKRERSVGRAVVERQYQSFELSKDVFRQEGFDQVVELQSGDLEKIQIEILFRPVQRPQRVEASPARRFERSAQPYDRRQGGDGPKVSSLSKASVPSPVQPAVVRRPDTPSGSVSPPQGATTKPAEAPAPVAQPQPALGGQTAASPPNASKKDT